MSRAFTILLGLLVAGCTIGSSTTLRPAFNRPAIEPDGTVWDAIEAARRNDTEAFRYLLSTRFIHEGILPNQPRDNPRNAREFAEADAAMREQLARFNLLEAQLVRAYLSELLALSNDRFVDVGKPQYQIDHTDGLGRATGPNRAQLVVEAWDKGAIGAEARSVAWKFYFVQDGQRWVIDDLDPNPLKGAFSR